MKSARGARLCDVEDKEYADYCMAFGPLILGHRHPAVHEAVTTQLAKGWSFGTAETGSLELAELLVSKIGWIDSVRFVNSGTEAVMSALRLARATTGRDRVLKFDGCYHGHVDSMLVRAGSGVATGGTADSAGIAEHVAGDTLVAPLDDEAALDKLFEQFGGQIAAAIIEPVPANFGLLPQRSGFLERLAKLCNEHGSLLIFDEVITGFRLGFGGFTEQSGITPDIVTWGKIIGGGFPVGAFAARREIMDHIAPVGKTYQAGTLSANPVAMAAGLATLRELLTGDSYAQLERLGQALEKKIGEIEGVGLTRRGSIFWVRPLASAGTIRTPNDIGQSLPSAYAAFFHALLQQGIYMPPSPLEVGFLSTAHDETMIEELGETIAVAMQENRV